MSRTNLMSLLVALTLSSVGFGQLLVDFNSTSQDDGPHNDTAGGFSAYDAGHEVAEDFVTQSFSAFGTSIGVTPTWPATTDNRVQQSIDRNPANDANWTDAESDLGASPVPILSLDLVTDWLGIDTRTGNGGNGDYDGTTGTPTELDLTLSGLPAGSYDWSSAHIDTENVHGEFQVHLSTDGGTSFDQLANGRMVDATDGGNPNSLDTGFQSGLAINSLAAATEGGIYATSFTADGTSDVILKFTPLSQGAVHRQLFGINGFVLTEAVPEPNSAALLGLAMLGMAAIARRRR